MKIANKFENLYLFGAKIEIHELEDDRCEKKETERGTMYIRVHQTPHDFQILVLITSTHFYSFPINKIKFMAKFQKNLTNLRGSTVVSKF